MSRLSPYEQAQKARRDARQGWPRTAAPGGPPQPPPVVSEQFQVMDPLQPHDLAALRESIRERGVLVPVVVDQHGRIIDGHNRRALAAELRVACPEQVVEVVDKQDAAALAWDLNTARRQMTREQRASAVLALRRRGFSLRAIAEQTGQSATSVRRDLAGVPQGAPDTVGDATVPASTPGTVTGRDGKHYPTSRRPLDDAADPPFDPATGEVLGPEPPRSPALEDLHTLAERMNAIVERGPDPRLPCGCDRTSPGLLVDANLDPTGQRCARHDKATREAAEHAAREQRRQQKVLDELGGEVVEVRPAAPPDADVGAKLRELHRFLLRDAARLEQVDWNHPLAAEVAAAARRVCAALPEAFR